MQTNWNANVTTRTTDWHAINWRKANRIVRNLRLRIFKATQDGKLRKVRQLQRLMLRSYSNVLLSVRRVTQINQGKNTPGVDKLVVKTPKARGELVDELAQFLPRKPLPARRVQIPKANGKKRVLGISSIRDRCRQAIVKNALEPAWESKLSGTSYGYRPGRSAQDAIQRIYTLAGSTRKRHWLVDGDIEQCFDTIAHDALIKAIGNFPGREMIGQWLKAGYMEAGRFHETDQGVSQGNIVSPLLANIMLHGMGAEIIERMSLGQPIKVQPTLIQYADDLVAFCQTQQEAEQVKFTMNEWLTQRGLKLSKAKTRIVHLREGFNFLGFNIRHYRTTNTKTGWKLLIKPSKESVQKLRNQLRQEWLKLRGQDIQKVINKLNPIIRGWANYYRGSVASKVISNLDAWMFKREYRYTRRMHPNKSKSWQQQRYWGRLNLDRKDNWVFGDKQTGNHLLKFGWFKIERHVLVKGNASPDDPTLQNYWKKREKRKLSNLTPSLQKLAMKQGCKCPLCGESLFNGEDFHRHHKVPKAKAGKDTYSNLEIVHLLCHQQIHLGPTQQ